MALPAKRTPEEEEKLRSDIRSIQKIKRFAWWLDECITLPGNIKIGFDGLIGMIPVLGDALGALLASFLVYRVKKLGVPRALLMKMVANVLLEFLVGLVPLLGDLFDFYFKANRRNVALLLNHEQELRKALEQEKSEPPSNGYKLVWLSLAILLFLVAYSIFVLNQ